MRDAAYSIRRARLTDKDAVRSIEDAAALRFADVGMFDIASGTSMSAELFERFLALGTLYLLLHQSKPVGFVAGCLLDGAGHVAELSVLPEHAGRRLGSTLIDQLASWTLERGARQLSLTTFRDVPWNAPYYARLGFRVVSRDAVGPGHQKVWEEQRAMGLDMDKRVLMVRTL